MALVEGEALTAYSFEFSIDGQSIPNIQSINEISQSTQTIETKSMTPTGLFQIKQMLGPRQSGTLNITVLSTGDPAVTAWFMTGLTGDFKGARKTGSLIYKDTYGTPVMTIEFSELMATSVSYGAVTAGQSSAISMTIALTFSEMKVS
jgi:phage tail-like protein